MKWVIKLEREKLFKMKISEFVEKHKYDLGISYNTVHRLIKDGALKENIHYRKTSIGIYGKYRVMERPLLKYFKGERK